MISTNHGNWQRSFALMVLPAFALFALGMSNNSLFLFSDGDTNWHIATGRWILSHGSVPATDPFSYTAAGQPWITHEWLSEVLMALAYMTLGWGGVALLTCLAAAAVAATLANELRKKLSDLSAIVILGMSAALFLPHYLARPHIIALPLMLFWTIRLMTARDQDRLPPLWLLPLMALWANLHGSFIFGLAFTSFFALEAVLAARTRAAESFPRIQPEASPTLRIKAWIQREASLFLSQGVLATGLSWGGFLAAAICMSFITPGGLEGFLYPFHVMSMKNLLSIEEWRAENFQRPSALQFVMFCSLAVCLLRGVRIGAVRLGLLLLLLYMSLQHWRQEFVLAVIAPLLLAGPLALALEAKPAAPLPPFREVIAPVITIGLLFVSVTIWRLSSPEERTDQATTPVTALAHVPSNLRTRPVFNDYGFGGWLIFKDVKPFMDGRSDMYGDELLKSYLDVSAGDRNAIDRVFSAYDVRWSILQPSSPLVAILDTRRGWRRIYADKWAVVQAQMDSMPQAVPDTTEH